MSSTALSERPVDVARVVTADELALIKTTVAVGATDAELKLFLFDCARQGVHPLDRLIHFTKRSGKYTPITSIDFMRIRAAETGEYAGSDDPDFNGYVTDGADGPPHRATVTVWRLVQGQRCSFTATARWAEYKPEQNDFMWRKMPHTMLGKCAEALALRKGFPRQLAGLYAKEEMEQADSTSSPERASPAGTPAGTINAPSVPNGGASGVLQAEEVEGELPPGYHRIDDYKPDGAWHHITWGRDAQGGSLVYKTKLTKVANAARVAYNDRIPVRLICKKFPYLDAVEPLAGWPTQDEIAATQWQPEPPPLSDEDVPFVWLLPFILPAIGLVGAVLA